jgi:hypothetical protein
MKTKIYPTSNTPQISVDLMMDSVARFLWREFDSAECKDWEIAGYYGPPCIAFETHYEGTDRLEMGRLLLEAVVGHLSRSGFKFRVG